MDTTTGTATNYTSLTYSNHTIDGSSSHYNRTTPRVQSDRVYIWVGVSDLLASYMTPWVVDHTNSSTVGNTNYYDQYLYNYGWSPTYNTGWRLYSEALSAVGYNYFWDWATTNYFHANYDYYLANTNSDAPSWHYPRDYLYEQVSDPSYKHTTIYTEFIMFASEGVPCWFYGVTERGQRYGFHDATNYYYKYQPEVVTNYTLDVLTTYYIITEPLYTIKYQVYPESPPFYAVTSFWTAHSNTLGGTNWLLNPSYLCETQTVLSNSVMSITNDGVVDSWTNYYTTNTVITNAAAYSNDWAISLWGDSFIQRYDATELLLWTSYGAYIESETRTIGWVTSSVSWATTKVTTNTGGAYNSSIQGYGFAYSGGSFYYIYSKTRIRAKRLAGYILDGAIDCYMKFGMTLSGRYDLDSLGYAFGPYLKVSELTIASGATESGWLGDLTLPSYTDLTTYDWAHPWGYKIQNQAGAAVFVFKPEF